jgi:hypothetical protein
MRCLAVRRNFILVYEVKWALEYRSCKLQCINISIWDWRSIVGLLISTSFIIPLSRHSEKDCRKCLALLMMGYSLPV